MIAPRENEHPDASTVLSVLTTAAGLGAIQANNRALNEKTEQLKNKLAQGEIDPDLIRSMGPLLAESARQEKFLSNCMVHLMGNHREVTRARAASEAGLDSCLASVDGFEKVKDRAAEEAREEAAAAAKEEKMTIARSFLASTGITIDDLQQ
jgi:hypothetical protein